MISLISIKYEYFCLLLIIFFLRTVKCFQVFLFNTNNSIKHQSFAYTQLNDQFGGGRGVMVIIVGNGHGNMSSNPGLDW